MFLAFSGQLGSGRKEEATVYTWMEWEQGQQPTTGNSATNSVTPTNVVLGSHKVHECESQVEEDKKRPKTKEEKLVRWT